MRWLSLPAPHFAACALVLGHIFFAGAQPAYAMPMIAATGLAALSAAATSSRRRPLPSMVCLVLASLFAIYMLARTALSPTYHLARENFFSIFCCLAVYLATSLALTGPKARAVIVWAILVLIAPNVLVGAVQFFKDPTFTILNLPRPPYGGRASGLFICPNHLAGFLEMALPFCLSALFFSRWPLWQRLLAGYLAGVALFGVFITGSRGGYLSTAVSLVVWSLLALWIRGRVNAASLIKGGAGIVIAALLMSAAVQHAMQRSPMLKERFENLINLKDFRVFVWPAAIREFQENPIVGAGAQQFVYYGRKYRDPRIQNDPVHAHSDYLQILADYGAVGGALALLLLVGHFGVGFSRLARNVKERAAEDPAFRSDSVAWSVAALAGLAAIVAHSAVDFNMHIPANAWLAAWLLGILANEGVPARHPFQRVASESDSRVLKDRREDSEGRQNLAGTLIRAVLLLVGVGLLAIPFFSARAEYHREMARLGRRLERYGDAVKHGMLATELDPNNGHSWMILGDSKRRLALRVEDAATRRAIRRSAEANLRRAAELLPNDAETWRYWGRVLDTLGRFDEARVVLDRALALDPNLYLSHEFLGWHFNLQGRFAEAEAAYKRAMALHGTEIAREQLEEIQSRKAREE